MIKSIVKFSQLGGQLDAGYYKPELMEVDEMLKRLPIIHRLNEVSTFQKLRYFPGKESGATINYLDIANVDLKNGDAHLQTLPIKSVPSRARRKVMVGDVCVSMVRPARNAVVLITDDLKEIVCSTGFAVINPDKVNSEYLFAFLKTKFAINQLVRATSAAMYPAISEDNVFEILIPVPREKLQMGISKLVKQSFSSYRLAKQKYQEAQELLNDCLKVKIQDLKFPKTFSLPFSKLEDRLDGEYYQTKSLGYSKLLYDSGNKTMTLGEIAKEIKYGTSDKVVYQEKGIPFLRVTDINKHKTINPIEGKFISENEALRLKPYQVKKNDLIISRTGTLGLVIFISDDLAGSVFGSYFIKVTPKIENNILPQFISIFLNSAIGKLQTDKLGSGGIQTNLTIEMIKSLIFPVMEIQKQTKICNLYNESILLQKESEELLKKAKLEVERIIEKGGTK